MRKVLAVKKLPRKLLLKLSLKVTTGFSDKSHSLVVELLPNKLKSLGSISLAANCQSAQQPLGLRKALSRVTLEKFLTP